MSNFEHLSYERFGGVPHCVTRPNAFMSEITPDEAADLLVRNKANRPIKKNHINDIARDIAAGRWCFNGDAIRFSDVGELIDGQHRLIACVQAGKPITTMVVTGVAERARATIDRGVKRTIGDQLSLASVPNAKRVASTVRELVGLADGSLSSARVTASEVARVLNRHPGIVHTCADTRGMVAPSGLILAIAYSGTSDGYTKEADAWREVWASGVPHYMNDPAHLVRERLFKERKFKTTHLSIRRLVLNAWINFRRGVEVKQARESGATSLPGWSRARLGLEDVAR